MAGCGGGQGEVPKRNKLLDGFLLRQLPDSREGLRGYVLTSGTRAEVSADGEGPRLRARSSLSVLLSVRKRQRGPPPSLPTLPHAGSQPQPKMEGVWVGGDPRPPNWNSRTYPEHAGQTDPRHLRRVPSLGPSLEPAHGPPELTAPAEQAEGSSETESAATPASICWASHPACSSSPSLLASSPHSTPSSQPPVSSLLPGSAAGGLGVRSPAL